MEVSDLPIYEKNRWTVSYVYSTKKFNLLLLRGMNVFSLDLSSWELIWMDLSSQIVSNIILKYLFKNLEMSIFVLNSA